MKIFRSRISFAPWLVGLVCVFAARAGLAQPSCLDSMPDPPFLASEPGLPACPVALQAPQPCSCAGTLAYCNSYSPATRGDDAPAINACLDNKDCKCVQLQAMTYRLRSPIVVKSVRMENPKDPNASQNILDGARILGTSAGAARSILKVENGNCTFPPDSLDSTGQRYAPIIEVSRTLNVTLDGFDLDVSDLRESCAGAPVRLGSFAIRFTPNVDGARITNLKVSGQRFGSAGYNGGGGTTGGIYVQTGANAVVQGNTLTDLGYLRGLTPSGAAAGSSGVSTIQIVNSASSCVAQNRLERIGFGIEVVNFASAGDSSKTQVVANAVEGAAGLVGCDNCSQGRVIKLQACRDGANGPDPEPLQDLSVRSNKACLFGGLRNRDTNGNIALIQEGSGIDLICGVQFSKFRSNVFDGRRKNSMDQRDSAALFTLQTRSQLVDSRTRTFILGYSPKTTTHHNLFENNTAFSGRGGTTCDNNCADIRINADSPDQINIGRTTATSPTPGNNLFNGFLRLDNNAQSCQGSDFSQVKAEQLGPDLTSKIRLSTRGVTPMTPVTVHFLQGSTDKPFTFTTTGCTTTIMKRARKLVGAAGTYTVTADYQDGNSRSGINMDQAVTILGDRLGSLTVGASSVPPPVVGNLTVTPPMLNFAAQAGGPNPANQVLSIGSTQGQVEWEAIPSVPWLTATASGAFTPASLTVGANTAGMPAGTYTASILLNSIDSNEILLPVTLNVGGAGGSALTVTPASLAFSGTQGGMNPLPQGLSIGSTGAALSWSASDDAPWLSLTATSGTTPSGTMATVNLAGLSAGTYTATITTSSPTAPNSPITRPVTLNLAPATPSGQLAVTPASITATTAVGVEPPIRTLTITSPGSPLTWSVTSSVPWITFSTSAGTTPGSTFASFNTAAFPAGTYSGNIMISAPGAATLAVPVTITIGSGGGGGGTLSVRVMQPNGGEFFQTGQTVAIQWTSTEAVAHDIAYSLNGLTFTNLATSYTASSTTYMWRIPTNLVPSQNERPLWIRVIARASTGATAEDRSDAFATVFNPF